MPNFNNNNTLITTWCLLFLVLLLPATQKTNGTPYRSHYANGGKATFTLNGKTYNADCHYTNDTVFRNPVAFIPAIIMLAANGTDSLAIAILNVTDKAQWSGTFIGGDSAIVSIDQNNKITYHNDYITTLVTHVNGANFISLSLSNAGGEITKTGANTFTFSFTTHPPGKTTTDITVKGSGWY